MFFNSKKNLKGKSIHNTYIAHSVNTHYGYPLINMKNIPIKEGHVSHFRKDYNIYWDDKSVMDFQFDLNYFLCYFKPIAKKFSIKLI